jgi:NAD(P)-dependent dehydrogenase (short-subunit alcohol dehydrogenase family)
LDERSWTAWLPTGTSRLGSRAVRRRTFPVNFTRWTWEIGRRPQQRWTRSSPEAAAKGALETATRIWAGELAPSGITVNAVAPGPIETGMYRERSPVGSEREARVLERIPLQRVGTSTEIAHVICMLLHEDAGYMTGQIVRVDGGGSIGAT